ncbi:MAG: nucleotidyltransferase family protein, partial [Synergistaceae bacterium]
AAVVVLSSNFVQRGEPAIINKHLRAETALACGADLVLELPLPYSSHNAGVFANAAVDILGATNVVSHIAYGAESPDWQADRILDILIHEPEPFKLFLKEELKKGKSFVQSRADALDFMIPGTASHLKGSNNTLALSYLLRIKRKNWNMIPVPIQRIGSSYNDEALSEISSATAIRKAVAANDFSAFDSMPPQSAHILKDALDNGRACTETERMWAVLRAMLLRSDAEEIAKFAEIGESIEFLMKSSALISKSYEEWVASCVSKRYPRGRIQRQAMHFMTGLSHWSNRAFQRIGPPYIRVLGMNGTG